MANIVLPSDTVLQTDRDHKIILMELRGEGSRMSNPKGLKFSYGQAWVSRDEPEPETLQLELQTKTFSVVWRFDLYSRPIQGDVAVFVICFSIEKKHTCCNKQSDMLGFNVGNFDTNIFHFYCKCMLSPNTGYQLPWRRYRRWKRHIGQSIASNVKTFSWPESQCAAGIQRHQRLCWGEAWRCHYGNEVCCCQELHVLNTVTKERSCNECKYDFRRHVHDNLKLQYKVKELWTNRPRYPIPRL